MKSLNLKGFKEIKQIGHGTYGNVYKAKRETDNNTYAVKAVNVSHFSKKEIQSTLNEVRIMASFTKSPFIVRFYEALYDNKRLCIITEYACLGDLSHLIARRKKKNKPFNEETIWIYFLQILIGLSNLHSKGVIHRDLKSANILMVAPDLAKIGDLGISTVLQTKELAKTQIGTPLYLAPEIWKKRSYNQKCDMWSLGILLYEMMYFCHPFRGYNQNEIAHRVCSGKFKFPAYLNELDFVPKATHAQGPVRPQIKKIRKPVSGSSSQCKSSKQERVFHHYSKDLIHIVQLLLQVNPVLRPTAQDSLNLPSVQKRLTLLERFMENDSNQPFDCDDLLSTIKIPKNLRNVNFPDPTYNKNNKIKPIEKRMHVKDDAPIKKELNVVNSPEMKLITERDWWAPIKSSKEIKSDDDLIFDDDGLNENNSNNVDESNNNENDSNNNINDNDIIILNNQINVDLESCENHNIMTPKRPRSSPCRKNVNRAPRNYKLPCPPMPIPKDKRINNPRFKLPIIR